MKAEDTLVTNLLQGAKQFIVPIFQRDYSWGTKHCQQLWKDVIRVGSDPNVKGHFLGSVVYVAAEDNTATITRWLLIDGQQRLTTLTLLLIALRDRMAQLPGNSGQGEEEATPDELDDYYLRNRHGKGDRRHKLHLRRADHETLIALLDGKTLPEAASERVKENFLFLREAIVAGLGVGLVPDYVVQDLVSRGEMLTALDNWKLSIFGTQMYMLYMPNRHHTRAASTFIDFMLAQVRQGA